MSANDGSSTGGLFQARVAGATAEGPSSSSVRFSESTLARERGVRLYHCEFVPDRPGEPTPGALIALMHGYGEHCRRYDALARHFAERGHVVCALDARGHGRSSGQRGHVRDYREYVEDFAAFVELVRARHTNRPMVVLGHSNGGLIAVRAAQCGLLGAARGLILTSPLIGLREHRRAVPDVVARTLSVLLPRLPVPNGIRSEDLTHDRVLMEAHRTDRWKHGVATARWYWAMTLATRAALAEAQRVTLPLLIAQAELDPIVDPAIVAEFHARAGSADKRLIVRQGEFHEVLNETARLELFAILSDWVGRVIAR
jgi:alpha-beta hydrolase superfamily lysophospholipase